MEVKIIWPSVQRVTWSGSEILKWLDADYFIIRKIYFINVCPCFHFFQNLFFWPHCIFWVRSEVSRWVGDTGRRNKATLKRSVIETRPVLTSGVHRVTFSLRLACCVRLQIAGGIHKSKQAGLHSSYQLHFFWLYFQGLCLMWWIDQWFNMGAVQPLLYIQLSNRCVVFMY